MQDRLKELRDLLNLNQTEFGRAIGIAKTTVSTMERTGNVTQRNQDAICKKFHVNRNWLENGIGSVFEDASENVEQQLNLSKEQQELIKQFSLLSDEDQRLTMELLHTLLKK